MPDDGDEKKISVKPWEEIGKSVAHKLGALAVARVSFGNTDVEPLSQLGALAAARVSFGNSDVEGAAVTWEELEVEEGATVSAFGLVKKNVLFKAHIGDERFCPGSRAFARFLREKVIFAINAKWTEEYVISDARYNMTTWD